jgi:hypothetical protein
MIGTIIWYSVSRGIGTIVDTQGRRYFFHAGCILVGPIAPPVDSIVSFIADESPRLKHPEKLPVARSIEIINDVAPEDTIAGQAALATGVDDGSGVKQ